MQAIANTSLVTIMKEPNELQILPYRTEYFLKEKF